MSYIDTRDLAAELDELDRRQGEVENAATMPELYSAEDLEALEPLSEEECTYRAALQELADEIGSEFPHGATMIPVIDFEDYAQELAEDCGMVDSNAAWPVRHIDWEAAARELAYDYSLVTWEGVDYYVRTV